MSSSSEEMCPSCGKTFKQLSRHKCKGPTTSTPTGYDGASPMSSSSEEMCPTCGKTFKQLSRHKCKGPTTSTPARHDSADPMSSGLEEMCPTCGKTFKQLSRHKCKGPTTSTPTGYDGASPMSSNSEEMCPTCGKTFKQLSRHKCIEPTTSTPARHDSASPMSSNSEEMCLTCGKMFKQLSRHKCKGPTTSTPARHDSASPTSFSSEEMCPTCGKTFKQLSRHKCKGPTTSTPARHDSADPMLSNSEEMCPTCGKTFKQLSGHKCIEPITMTPAEYDGNGQMLSSSEEMCPTCRKTFKQLSRHKCKGIPLASPLWPDSAGLRDSTPEEMCPTCGKMFKLLSGHKCEELTPTSPFEILSDDDEEKKKMCPYCGLSFENLNHHECQVYDYCPSPLSSQTDRENVEWTSSKDDVDDKVEVCPTCGLTYKRLSNHKCKRAAGDSDEENHPTCGLGFEHSFPEVASTLRLSPERTYCQQNFKQPWQDTCEPLLPSSAPGKSEKGKVQFIGIGSDDLCTQDKENCSSVSQHQWKEAGHTGASPTTESALYQSTSSGIHRTAGSEGSSNTGNGHKACPGCGKHFKRLHQHKCKAVVIPPATNTTSMPSKPPQDSRGYTPTLDTKALEEEAQKVMEALGLQAAAEPNSDALGFFEDEVKLKKEEKCKAFEAFRGFQGRIKKLLEESTECKTWEILNSGSSYDGTKVARADEIDCMFSPRLPSNDRPQINCENAPPGFCFVELTEPAALNNPFLKGMCDDRGRLSSRIFRDEIVFKVFKDAVEAERRAEVDPDTKAGSPSFAVILKAFPSGGDGAAGGNLRPISIDLVPALKLDGLPPGCEKSLSLLPDNVAESVRRAGFHVIPKMYLDKSHQHVSDFLWRLSFSRAEKEITKHADQKLRNEKGQDQDAHTSPPTCRKLILRMLKRMLEIFKGMKNSRTDNPKMQQLRQAVDYLRQEHNRGLKVEKFTTFQVRTLLWTEIYQTCPDPVQWRNSNRRTRLMHSLMQLNKMLSGRLHVSHFFLPHVDIMAEVPRDEREFLYIMFYIVKELF